MHKANVNYGDDPGPITSARQAAEALFAPKPEAEEQPLSGPGQPVVPRRPRVLPALCPAAIRRESIDMTAPLKQLAAPDIPAKKSAHVRTLLKYGMTASQVAEVYGVPVETIARILRKV